MTNDGQLIARIIELCPVYLQRVPDTKREREPWGESFIAFAEEMLSEEYPDLTQEQFNRCHVNAFEQSAEWRHTLRQNSQGQTSSN